MKGNILELLKAPLQIQLGKLLKLVPSFHKALFVSGESSVHSQATEDSSIQVAHLDVVPTVPMTDVLILEITVNFKGLTINHMLIDGGAGVNIATKATC